MIKTGLEQRELASVSYVGPQTSRPKLLFLLKKLERLPGRRRLASPVLLRLFARETHDLLLRSNADRRILSEENILGRLIDGLQSPRGIYDAAKPRLEVVKALLGGEPARIVLSVRHYGEWFISGYSWRAGYGPMPDIETLAADWHRLPRRWTDVVADAISVFGNCTVVPFGDPHVVARELVGDAVERLQSFHAAASLPAAALSRVQKTSEFRKSGLEGHKTAEALREQFADEKPFQPFSKPQMEQFSETYARDLDAMAGLGATLVGRQ